MAVDQPPGDGNTNDKARRKRDPERMQERILAAARQEFSDRGLDGARVDRIAELSGGNKRLLYHYFSRSCTWPISARPTRWSAWCASPSAISSPTRGSCAC